MLRGSHISIPLCVAFGSVWRVPKPPERLSCSANHCTVHCMQFYSHVRTNVRFMICAFCRYKKGLNLFALSIVRGEHVRFSKDGLLIALKNDKMRGKDGRYYEPFWGTLRYASGAAAILAAYARELRRMGSVEDARLANECMDIAERQVWYRNCVGLDVYLVPLEGNVSFRIHIFAMVHELGQVSDKFCVGPLYSVIGTVPDYTRKHV